MTTSAPELGTNRGFDGTSSLVSRIRAASRRPANLGHTPLGSVSLAMGEPYADTAPSITTAAIEALDRHYTRYAAMTGDPDLRDAIASRLEHEHRRSVTRNQITLSHGASAGLAATVLSLVDPGDRVVIPEPTYSLYADHVAMAGGQVHWLPCRPDGTAAPDELARALTGAKMLILCTPGNPTGQVLDRAVLASAAEQTHRAGAYLLSDEAYADIVFAGARAPSVLDLDGDADHVVCVRTFSKSYAMTGWRLGYVVAAPHIADRVGLVHRSINGALNTFVQKAGIAALTTPRPVLERAAAEYRQRRDLVTTALSTIEGVTLAEPQGAFYAFPHVAGADSDKLVARFAERGVLVRSGTEYGPSGAGHFRISFATGTDTLQEGLNRIIDVLRGEVQ